MKYIVLVLTVVSTIAGCSSNNKITTPLAEVKQVNVAYGSFPGSIMDVYLPANRNPQTPFVILIHGGAWILGDKIFEHQMQDSLLANGIASVNINYRFADSLHTHYSQMLADIDSAVVYCMAHANAWHTRKENFITSGTSAGAHLSLMYAYTTNKKISAVIARCAPTDLTDTSMLNYELKNGLLPVMEKMAGARYKAGQPLPAEFEASSPVSHVKNIPTLIIHGTADKTVPYSQAVNLDKKLTSQNITHKLITLQGADHDLNPKPPVTIAMLYKEMLDWIWKYGR